MIMESDRIQHLTEKELKTSPENGPVPKLSKLDLRYRKLQWQRVNSK